MKVGPVLPVPLPRHTDGSVRGFLADPDPVQACRELWLYPDIAEGVEARCGWIAPISVYPGECEQEAMAQATLEVLRGRQQAGRYTGVPVFRGFDWE